MKPNHLIAIAVAVLVVIAIFVQSGCKSQNVASDVATQQQSQTTGASPVDASKTPSPVPVTAAEQGLEEGRRVTEMWANTNLNGISFDSHGSVTIADMPGIVNRSRSHHTVATQVLDDCMIGLNFTLDTHRQVTGQPDSDETSTKVCRVNLSGLPDSAISVKSFDPNFKDEFTTVSSGPIFWTVNISDAQRINCTDIPHAFAIEFKQRGSAERTATSIREFVHQHCSR